MLTISIITIIIIFSLPLSQNKINSIIIRRLCAICLLYAGVLSFNTLYIQLIGSGIGLYNNFLQVNIITSILSTFILLISSIIVIIWPITESIKLPISNFSLIGNLYKKTVGIFDASPGSNSRLNLNTDKEIVFIPIATRSQETNKSRSNEYCLIILFNILGAILLMSSLDFITMFLSIELQSFALYILVSIYKDKKRSTSAGLKYFLLGGLSSSLILFGAAIIYSYTGSTNLDSIHQIISIYFNSTDQEIINLNTNNYFLTEIKGISLGILFIFSGFLFKIAAAPFHN
jgi:NADH-ubiquinone oxidoreductase chain 2